MVEQKYVEYWRSRQAQQRAQVQLWEKEAWIEVERAVGLLRDRFGATAAIVFGSLVKDRFGEDSDIDLAVEGIAKARFFEALTAVNAHSKWWVDLKPLEDLEARFKAKVLATGSVIDEDG
ncbi:MAG: nucleotidyltransferase domain-containing protein [Phormidesmis sp.]